MTPANKTWIVVADGAKASIFVYKGPNNSLELVPEGTMKHTNQPSRELVSTKRGRVFHGTEGARSAMERPTDPHEHEKRLFARDIAHFLVNQSSEYERLILCSPPKMLGELRRQLPDNIKNKLSAELDKDLTQFPFSELPKHLQDVIYINP